MSAPDLNALIGERTPGRRGRPVVFPPDVASARHAEQMRRGSRAQRLAFQALAKLHPDDYRSLYEQAKVVIEAERGPLPGDDPGDLGGAA